MNSIDWKPDKASSIPMHIQITQYVKTKISCGEWSIGSKLPAQRKLAELFGVNRSTVVSALDELMADGFIEGKSGSGTTIINNTWSLLTSTPPPDWNSYIEAGIHEPNHYTIQQINKCEFIPGIVRLGTGELSPELYPREEMQAVLGKLPDIMPQMGYEEPKGLLRLRKEVSSYVESLGIKAPPSCILIVSGALQALQLISIGLLHRGSAILLERPSYLYSLHVFQSAGIQLSGIPVDDDGIRVELVETQKRQRDAALLYTIPTFHNPTGAVLSEARRLELVNVCEAVQLPVIEDDVYRELWLEQMPPKPLKALDKSGTVLYLGSMSKSLSPGLRIGWVIGPEPVIERLADIKMQTDYGSSSLSQWAAAEWLSSGLYGKHIEYVRDELRLRRDLALSVMEKHYKDIAEWKAPKGGFYIWTRLKGDISLQRLFDKALSDGILLNPGSVYDSYSNHNLRISYAYASMNELEKGLLKLAAIIKAMRKE